MSAFALKNPLIAAPAARAVPAPSRVFACVKRSLDIAAVLSAALVIWPVLLFCAAWIKLADGGPVLYAQWRIGQDGWLFRIYKFRTMTLSAEMHGAQLATRGDPRIIRGCGWMRKSHADELPQLWNILAGQMSLVGPRPERPEIVEKLRPSIRNIDMRLLARPGLTGLAQVRNGYSNDLPGMRRKLAYDLRYLRRRNLWTELGLIAATLPRLWDRAAV